MKICFIKNIYSVCLHKAVVDIRVFASASQFLAPYECTVKPQSECNSPTESSNMAASHNISISQVSM